ncbi:MULTISPECIES: IS66 family transposase [unclassified Caballeronia]|jgi:transposase|uniref:IS66 family transposase n=1 Tax=unclassified Caballeronia TaxID=2646786 RepID=UPI0028603427|nr:MULTISPECIES: IS66 family transposase [unclassified Caballeronia]MDR5776535.1 IS66 family transposase [Caballeronia sp. LZ002]MDR5800983.1 IS66 family transposase [Caballeronia sp. LZ001]MDR5851970.1 IS66 family transposase [Caballeronia sp. LZ003]
MESPTDLDALNPDQLRALARQLMTQVDEKTRESHYRQTRIDQLTHELSVIKRLQFGRRSEQLTTEQLSLLDEAIDEDLAALEAELDELRSDVPQEKPRKCAKRLPLPPQLPRTDIHHEPTELSCSCGCQRVRIGEDISEKLDYTPGVFTVERHIRGKWACKACETLVQAPVPPHVIDKGIPTNGLLAQVLVAKYGDHLPLYRQERIFARAGVAIPQSTLGGWVGICGVRLQPLVEALREELLRHTVVHADETPVQMLSPGKGKTHCAYLWAYTSTQFADVRAVVYEFADGRSGEHARAFLGDWRGKLVVDDYSGYKAGFKLGITEIGCMAHARRKFFDLYESKKSQIAEQALKFFVALYDVEREAANLDPEQRRAIREERGRPIAQALHVWMLAQRKLVVAGSPIAKALDYNLKRWQALTRYLDDPQVPIDNNRIENLIRPWAIGRANWLFAGSLRAGQRAAAIMSLVRSAQLNGHDPYAYLKDILTRLPTQRADKITELLPHNWVPAAS